MKQLTNIERRLALLIASRVRTLFMQYTDYLMDKYGVYYGSWDEYVESMQTVCTHKEYTLLASRYTTWNRVLEVIDNDEVLWVSYYI